MNKKADFLFLITVVILAAALWAGLRYFLPTPGGIAVVTVAGVEYGRYALAPDCTVSVPIAGGGYNLLVISEHYAFITDADCPDRLCVKQKHISRQGESIICLPHKLVVRIEQGEEGERDGNTY